MLRRARFERAASQCGSECRATGEKGVRKGGAGRGGGGKEVGRMTGGTREERVTPRINRDPSSFSLVPFMYSAQTHYVHLYVHIHTTTYTMPCHTVTVVTVKNILRNG